MGVQSGPQTARMERRVPKARKKLKRSPAIIGDQPHFLRVQMMTMIGLLLSDMRAWARYK